jgi:hypothetical protein
MKRHSVWRAVTIVVTLISTAVAGATIIVAPAGASGPTWSKVAITSPGGSPFFSTMTCVSGKDCWSPGDTAAAPKYATVAVMEHWNGKTWSPVSTPVHGAALGRVACVTAKDCWVGGFLGASNGNVSPVVERWNGKSWASSSLPSVSGSDQNVYVDSVTCLSASSCYAMGGAGNSATSPYSPVVFHWNGATWSTMAGVPMPTGYKSADIEQMRCPTSTICVTEGVEIPTGSYFDRVYSDTLHGSTWKLHQMPQPYHAQYSYSDAPDLTCSSSTQCVAPINTTADANGKTEYTPFLELWNGSSWKLDKVPTSIAKSYGQFTDVACLASSKCWVTTDGGVDEWTGGTSWTAGSTPEPANSDFDAVACVPANACYLLGVTSKDAAFANRLRLAQHKSPRPVVKKIRPRSGSVSGGARVVIVGHGFAKSSTVRFGKAKGRHVTDLSATKLRATSPRHLPGTVAIVVTSSGQHSAKVKADRFHYKRHS